MATVLIYIIIVNVIVFFHVLAHCSSPWFLLLIMLTMLASMYLAHKHSHKKTYKTGRGLCQENNESVMSSQWGHTQLTVVTWQISTNERAVFVHRKCKACWEVCAHSMPSIPTIPSACYRKMLQGVVQRFLTHRTDTEVYRVFTDSHRNLQ